MRVLLWRKGTRLLQAGFTFPRWLRNLRERRRPGPHTVQWPRRETHSWINTLVHLGVAHKNWPFSHRSSHGGLRPLEAESETRKRSWNDSGVTPGGVKLTSSTWAHYTRSLVTFIPDKPASNGKQNLSETETKEVSESQPLTNTPARFIYIHRAHTCKYLVNWRNYTKRDLNLTWPDWVSFDITKLIYLCAQLEKASRAYFDWYLEASKTANDRVTSLQKTNKKLLESIKTKTDC